MSKSTDLLAPRLSPFPQVEQVINRDSFITGSIRLLLLGLLFIGLGGWLFFGELTFYATSLETAVTPKNYILATFDETQLDTVRVEQVAIVEMINETGELVTAPAMVLKIDHDISAETGELTLLVTDKAAYLDLFDEKTAVVQQVHVQGEATSPIQFILTAAGLTKT